MNTLPISRLVGSSEYRAIADDTLKDEDNAAWIMELDPKIRESWVERIRWIRLADRLAENDLIDSEKPQFQGFHNSWKWLKETGQVQSGCPHSKIFYRMHDRWFHDPSDPISHLSIKAWDQYLSSLVKYHEKHLIISSLDQYEGMLEELAASFFRVLPFLAEHQWQAAGQFGTLDQFYNNLRDLREDAEQGICYLPTELLDRFQVSRADVLDLRAIKNPGYRPMMRFWVHEYLPQLHRKAYPFILAPDLHPSWQMLRDWSLHRYRRIERIFRRCDYDYLRFPKLYWQEVKRDLVLMLPGRFGSSIAYPVSNHQTSYLSRTSNLFQISQFNRLSNYRNPSDPPYTFNVG